MAKDSQGTVYRLFTSKGIVDVQSWITQNHITSSINKQLPITKTDPIILTALETSGGTYTLEHALPALNPLIELKIDGFTYELSQDKYQKIRGILDSTIRVSGN